MLAARASEPKPKAYLWPCNVGTWRHWCELQTQWRVGVNGATGMDYAGVRAYLDECGLTGDERRDVWAGIRACERGTLEGRAAAQNKPQ